MSLGKDFEVSKNLYPSQCPFPLLHDCVSRLKFSTTASVPSHVACLHAPCC